MIILFTIFNITTHPSSRGLVLHLTLLHLSFKHYSSSLLWETCATFAQHIYISMSQLCYHQQSFISLLQESSGLICFHHTFSLLVFRLDNLLCYLWLPLFTISIISSVSITHFSLPVSRCDNLPAIVYDLSLTTLKLTLQLVQFRFSLCPLNFYFIP